MPAADMKAHGAAVKGAVGGEARRAVPTRAGQRNQELLYAEEEWMGVGGALGGGGARGVVGHWGRRGGG